MKYYRKKIKEPRYEDWEEIAFSKLSGVVQNANGSVCYYIDGDLSNTKGAAIYSFKNQKYYYYNSKEIEGIMSNKEYRRYMKLLLFL